MDDRISHNTCMIAYSISFFQWIVTLHPHLVYLKNENCLVSCMTRRNLVAEYRLF